MTQQKLFKIAITGPESTGKSVLAQELAKHYQTLFVPEFARYYLKLLNRPYQAEDLRHISIGQQSFERALTPQANQLLIADTEMLVIKIWHQHAYQSSPKWLEKALQNQEYHLYLLMDVDLPWQPDPQREHPHLRDYFFGQYQQQLEAMKVNFRIISGQGKDRLERAIQYIDNLMH